MQILYTLTPLLLIDIRLFVIIFVLFQEGCPRGVMVKAMDIVIVVSSYSSRANTLAFGENTLGKSMNSRILTAIG